VSRRGPKRLTMEQRVTRWLARKTRPVGECLIWTGNAQAYKGVSRGKVAWLGDDGVKVQREVHRTVWEFFHPGVVLDRRDVVVQSCGESLCIRREHLVRISRSEEMRARYEGRTHCRNGHELTEENVRVGAGGRRDCRVCDKLATRARRAARKEAAR